jgi:hypothetical protein
MRIAVMSLYHENYQPLADIVLPNWTAYCKRHGYDLKVFRGKYGAGGIGYQKMRFLYDEMFVKGTVDLAWVVDLDVLITNHTRRIEEFVNKRDSYYLTLEPWSRINHGSFIVVKSEWSKGVVETVLSCIDRWGDEQTVLNKEYFETAKCEENRIAFLPHPSINSFMCKLYLNPALHDNLPAAEWAPGHFALHLMGISQEQRIRIFTSRFIQDSIVYTDSQAATKDVRVGVFTVYLPNYQSLADITLPNWREYCDKHGYKLFAHCSDRTDEVVGFQKIRYLYYLMFETNQIDLALGVDLDILFTNLAFKVEDFTDEDHTYYLTVDWDGINHGSFIVKKSDKSKKILEHILKLSKYYPNEQDVLKRNIHKLNSELFDNTIKLLNQPSVNSFLCDRYPEHYILPRSHPHNWERGHFILHCLGQTLDDRVKNLREKLGEVVCDDKYRRQFIKRLREMPPPSAVGANGHAAQQLPTCPMTRDRIIKWQNHAFSERMAKTL